MLIYHDLSQVTSEGADSGLENITQALKNLEIQNYRRNALGNFLFVFASHCDTLLTYCCLFLFQEGKVHKDKRRTKSSKRKKNKKHKRDNNKDEKKEKKKKKKRSMSEMEEKKDSLAKDKDVVIVTDSEEEQVESGNGAKISSNHEKRTRNTAGNECSTKTSTADDDTMNGDDTMNVQVNDKDCANENCVKNSAEDTDSMIINDPEESGGDASVLGKHGSHTDMSASAMEVDSYSDSDSLATGESEMESGEVTEESLSASEAENDEDTCAEITPTSVELACGPVAYDPSQQAAASLSGIEKKTKLVFVGFSKTCEIWTPLGQAASVLILVVYLTKTV